jgi:tetratricopeptide (TPR) repeat protein/O-antigen ligase
MREPSLAKWLRWLVYANALIPLVIFAQYMSPFHFGKVIVFRALVEAMVALYLLLLWRDRSYLPKSHPITWAFLAFTLAFTLTTITSVAPLQSFWGTLERMGGLFTFWHYFIFYMIAISVLRTKKDWQILLDLMVSVGLVSALYGFLQKTGWAVILGAGGRERIFGTIGNPALFAGYQILIAFLAATLITTRTIGPRAGVPRASMIRGAQLIGFGLSAALVIGLVSSSAVWLSGLWVVPLGVVSYGVYLFIAESMGGGRMFYLVTAALTVLAAASTAVRGSLVAIVVGAIVFLLLSAVVRRSRSAKMALLGSITVVAVFVFLGLLLRQTPLIQHSPYLKRVTDFSSQTFTVQTRLWAWSAGFKGWSESAKTILLGWGPENFNIPFSKYFNPKFFTGPGAETFFDRAHNMFVEILVTTGLVGELTYLAIFVTLFATLIAFMKRQGDERLLGIGLASLTVAYIIHNCFIFDTSANFLTFFMILAFVTHVAQRGLNDDRVEPTAVRPAVWTISQKTVAGILSAAVVVALYTISLKPALANYASTRAIVNGWQGDFQDAVGTYRKAIDAHTPGRYEFRQRFAQYLLEVNGSADVSKIPNFNDLVLQAVKDQQDSIAESPMDYLPYLYISRLYTVIGHNNPKSPYNQKALEYATKALEISPTFVRTYYEIAQAYLNIKDYNKAFEWFDKASKLNPDVGITYWYLGMVDYQRGDSRGALAYVQKAMDHGYTLTEEDAQKLVVIYLNLGDIKSIVTLYERLVRDFPDKGKYWAPLAAAYAQAGRVQDAIAAARKAISLNQGDAQFVQQANAFLRQLGVTP